MPERDQHAYEALAAHPRSAALAARTRATLRRALAALAPDGPTSAPVGDMLALGDVSPLGKLQDAEAIAPDEARTPFGNALEVLDAGPRTEDEQALARALAAYALASPDPAHAPLQPLTEGEAERLVADIVLLATQTSFDATPLLDTAFGERAGPLWTALARRVRTPLATAPPTTWGQTLVAASALAGSSSACAARLAAEIASCTDDARLRLALGAGALRGSARGEIARRPRSVLATAALGLTGISLLIHAGALLARWALAYRRPAELVVDDTGAVRVHSRVELLGRTLREQDMLVPRTGLLRATRDVRYPAAALYAGLLALVVGTYLGVSAFVDGMRVASPSLMTAGLGIAALGLLLDFALTSLLPGSRGQCRLVLVPRAGRPLCVGSVGIEEADALLGALARARSRITGAAAPVPSPAPPP